MDPKSLPVFENPPIQEVVLGIQFQKQREYLDFFAYEVWNLFKNEYPNIQEHPYLPPQFETFGGSQNIGQTAQIEFSQMRKRNFFIAADNESLVQFQADRMLHNWRRSDLRVNSYPKYPIISK